jgi:GT2 family glycosyltransferase
VTRIHAVIIGRNEGDRLLACLDALAGVDGRVIYVDSGSTDGSIKAATERGAEVVALDMSQPFTAARARNAGLDRLADEPGDDLVQTIDGDCALRDDWIATARAFLDTHSAVAVVCGRRRERLPDASIYNRLCDAEWDTPIGEARACGGDALFRLGPLRAAGFYRSDLIAGEEPELCLRLRAAGWKIWRLDAEMTWHDADMHRFGQWWARSRRAGFAFAEGAALHGAPPERHWVAETRRAIIWGGVLPLVVLVSALISPALAVLVALVWPLQIVRIALRPDMDLARAVFLTLGKGAEAQGVADYWFGRLSGRRRGLIEYK